MKPLYFYIGCGVILAVALCVFVLWRLSLKQHSEYENLLCAYRQLEAWNQELRGQRHDFLNHLHVIRGLLEVEEYDALRDYLAPICHALDRTGKAIRTKSPAVNALLAAKLAEAEHYGVSLTVEVSSSLSPLSIPDWDLVRILANLIDNAVSAARQTEQPRICVEISETKDAFLFCISNNGPPISPANRPRLFTPGFTTKTEEGHGMGLFIVSQLLRKNHGSIEWSSDETQTSFRILFRKEV